MTKPQDMPVRAIMSREVFSVTADRDLNFVEVVAEGKHIRHIPVVDENKHPVGLVSIRDILRHLSRGGADRFVPVGEVMSREVVSATPETPLSVIAEQMRDKNVSAVLVVERQQLVGVVTERDFLKLF